MLDNRFLTVAELALRLHFSPQTITRLIRRPEKPLPAIRINRTLRFSPQQVEAWLLEEQADAGGAARFGPCGPRPLIPPSLACGPGRKRNIAASRKKC